MKHLFLLSAAALLLSGVGCTPRKAPLRRTCLYAAVDTTWQLPMSCNFGYDPRFPYAEFHRSSPPAAADVHDGYCRVVFEIDRPVQVSVMPVRDSTAKLVLGNYFTVMPGDSLEVRTVTDPRITVLKAVKAELVGSAYADNAYVALLQTAFPPKMQPRFENDDIEAYRCALDAFCARKQAFLDSCSRAMPLSEHCIRQQRALCELERYNRLSSLLQKHPEWEALADTLAEQPLPEAGYGTSPYAAALLNKYLRNVLAEPEFCYEAIERGIRRAPRRLRDYLTALQIGWYAERQLSVYEEALTATIERAEQTIRDTSMLAYIARAKAFYADRSVVLPDSVLNGTRLQTPEGEELTLGGLLARYEGRPLYVDFWASWCTGCILDMQRSERAKAWMKEQGIVCIYLSIDEKFEDWQRASARHGVEGDSYLCLGEWHSPLTELLKIKSIPRYLLLDASHGIVSSYAPRPTDDGLPELKRLVDGMRSGRLTPAK